MFSPEGLSISDGKVTEMGVLPVFCVLQMVYSDCQGVFLAFGLKCCSHNLYYKSLIVVLATTGLGELILR